MRRLVLALLAVLVLLAGVALVALTQLRFGAGHQASLTVVGAGAATMSPSPSTDAPPGLEGRFNIRGNVAGLFPGASLPLVLVISNPQAFPIVVNAITVTVGDANAGCASTNLSVTQFAGSLAVPARGTATVTLAAALSHTTPDACQGAMFPLQYSGVAVKA